jgi:hypothetical protein
MSSAESYNQTILLDCNRLSSEEYSASNLATNDNAVFTNKVSNGITLDIGDEVTIASAHISQRGAGGSVIQMDGKTLGEKTITVTETTNSSFIGFDIPLFQRTYSPTGFAYETSKNVDKQVKIKDNKASVVFEYYKNTNGENNIGLPRNFGSASMRNSIHGGDPAVSATTTNASFWNASDSYAKGLNTYPMSGSHHFLGDYYSSQCMNACGNQCEVYKISQDNSRFTIFKRNEAIYRKTSVSNASNASYLQPVPAPPDPAIGGYNILKQETEFEIPRGYNTPSTIASILTDKCNLASSPVEKVAINGGPTVINGELYKSITSANYSFFSASENADFFNASLKDHLPIGVGVNACNTEKGTLYLNNYSFVGFKRPKLVEAGRTAFGYHGNALQVGQAVGASGTFILYSGFSWRESTFANIRKFFDSQLIYPELFNYATIPGAGMTNYSAYNTTSGSLNASFRDEARFLHIGISGKGSTASAADALGSDNYNVSHSSTFPNIPPRANASDNSSNPIFVYFNNNSSHLKSTETIGDRDDNLAYGFGRKYTHGGVDYIAFVTERIGGVPVSYFGEQGNVINSGTKCGYDFHFNAFGNAAIIPSSGFHPLQLYGHQEYSFGSEIREVYVGANDVLFNFNTAENRFEIKNLHSAEKVGNFYNAGDPNPPADVFAPPASAEATNNCYKINKQVKYDNWTPDLQPYSEINLSGSFSADTQQTFIKVNPALRGSTIFDSHGGVAIADMGVTEDKWTDSIWGLMGFEYGQFNTSGTNIKNLNVRFNSATTNTCGVTTNADVTTINSLQYSTNVYGTNMFTPRLNSDVRYFDNAQKINVSIPGASFSVEPPIVVSATSTAIQAKQLPRKLLRGYFLINSDILDTANYYQTANPLQTMAVVGKYNGANDFVQYDGGGATFTVTRKKTITSIKTQILDPEGAIAQVGDASGIIYKIIKPIKTDLKFAENLMAGMYGKPPGS